MLFAEVAVRGRSAAGSPSSAPAGHLGQRGADLSEGTGRVAEPAPADRPEVNPYAAPGHQLVAARTAAGVSVAELSHRTRIRVEIIVALEGNDFRAGGGACFTRGHLRVLGQTLAMDVPALLLSLDRLTPAPPALPLRTLARLTGPPDRDPGRRWTAAPATLLLLTCLVLLLNLLVH